MGGSDTLARNVANTAHDDIDHFYELLSKGQSRWYRLVKAGPRATPVYYIENNETLSKKKFNLIIHQGDSKHGKILGVVKMHLRGFTISLGNPATELEGKEMIWEELKRPKKWCHKIYTFDFGSKAQRGTYTCRKSYGVLGRLKGMELRAGCMEEEEGELLAKWVGSSKWNMKSGSMFIKRTEMKGQDQDVLLDEEPNKWEIVVCLAILSIIESQIRRSK